MIDLYIFFLCAFMYLDRANLFKHRNPTMAFELSIFDDINSESGLTYERTKIFLSLFEPISVFVVT